MAGHASHNIRSGQLREGSIPFLHHTGYLARNNDGPPGTKVLWTGMMTLGGMALGYRLNQTMALRESEP